MNPARKAAAAATPSAKMVAHVVMTANVARERETLVDALKQPPPKSNMF